MDQVIVDVPPQVEEFVNIALIAVLTQQTEGTDY